MFNVKFEKMSTKSKRANNIISSSSSRDTPTYNVDKNKRRERQITRLAKRGDFVTTTTTTV